MFKVINDNKIIGVSKDYPVLLNDYEVIEDTEHTVDEYEHYQGEFLLKSDIPAPTKEEVAETRKQLYTAQVDPITAQISRLRDEEQTDEIIAEIEALKAQRAEVVARIKEENPYPVEPTETATSNL